MTEAMGTWKTLETSCDAIERGLRRRIEDGIATQRGDADRLLGRQGRAPEPGRRGGIAGGVIWGVAHCAVSRNHSVDGVRPPQGSIRSADYFDALHIAHVERAGPKSERSLRFCKLCRIGISSDVDIRPLTISNRPANSDEYAQVSANLAESFRTSES